MMYSKLRFIGSLALASALLSSAASASTVLVTISDSLSGTVQSISDSISRASKSSSNAVNVAEGDYRIVDVAMAEGQPGKMRLTLQATAKPDDAGLYLFVPRNDYDHAALADGQIVTAAKRPYGMAFSKAQTGQPFAVVLEQGWLKELSLHVVAG